MKRQYIEPHIRTIWLDTEEMIAASVVTQQNMIEQEVVDESSDRPIWGDSGIWGN